MHYLITGGTGFIGRFLIERLLNRGAVITLLVRKTSVDKVEVLRQRFGVDEGQLKHVCGDLLKARLGFGKKNKDVLSGTIDHFVHLAAIYDIKSDEQTQIRANVEGTRNALDLAITLKAKCFHHVSSIAAAGLYEGTFTEEMFDEAEHLEHPYFRTKHDSEGLVRQCNAIPWRIYRPGIVVGDSQSGEIDKMDGPYYFFEAIRAISQGIPRWMPLISLGGGRLNIVPVDYVADAMDYLMHLPELNNECFFLTHPEEISVGELLETVLHAAHGPKLTVFARSNSQSVMARYGHMLGKVSALQVITRNVLKQYDIPEQALQFITYPTHFDSRKTQGLLVESAIRCPAFPEYADVIWRYWEQNLHTKISQHDSLLADFYTAISHSLRELSPGKLQKNVAGKVVVVTGASSGIGHEAALKLAEAGATVVLAARSVDKLQETRKEIESQGGKAYAYPCDIADMDSCEIFISQVLKQHGHVDILINNAGRSIRRSIEHSFERFHDYERTMQLNYFGALKLITGFAPAMLAQGGGHVINISSIGVLASPPRFSAYVASKAALDAFSWCAAAEFAHRNIHFTTINMPLVRTPMIAPTKLYDAFPTLSVEEAADLIMQAIVDKPKRIATPLGIAGAIAQAVLPNTSEFVLNQAFHLFPDSNAAAGDAPRSGKTPVQRSLKMARKMFSQVLPGVHW